MENSLNDMRLNDLLLVNLYPHSLYRITEEGTAPELAPVDHFIKFLGGNASGILVLVNDPKHKFLGEEEMNLLVKMLDACKLNTGDVAILNTFNQTHSLTGIVDQLRPVKILAFGPQPGIELAEFDIQEVNGIPVLQGPSLDTMALATDEAKTAKIKLWNTLKSMFGIK
ncbi:MAG TPA: hypothetical protein VK628_02750 [Flavitalea sp.]|nr:hypothetical protein [Flavitalea sp.]